MAHFMFSKRTKQRPHHKKDLANFTATRPTFWEGVARLFDFGGSLPTLPPGYTSPQHDWMAIAGDWSAIGGDLKHAMHETIGRQQD